jgi:formylglycine-generating enzyme required for sulfatase activity
MGSCRASSSVVEENKKRAFLVQAPITDNCNNPNRDEEGYEMPKHPANIQSFQIGKTEVTLRQFRQFNAGGC